MSYSYFLLKWRIHFVGVAIKDEWNYCRNPALMSSRVLTWVKFRAIEDFKGQCKQRLDSIKMSSCSPAPFRPCHSLRARTYLYDSQEAHSNQYVLINFQNWLGKINLFNIKKKYLKVPSTMSTLTKTMRLWEIHQRYNLNTGLQGKQE